MSQPVDKPILVYNRIAENRRMTVQLVALFILLLLPATIFLTQYLWANLLTMGLISLPFLSGPGYTYAAHVIGMVIVGVAFSLAVIWWEFRVAERVTLKGAGARPLQPEEGRELRRTVESLCIGAGLPQPELYLAFAGGTNAFTVGLAPDRAKLVITRGLMELLDRRELEGVVAQELSHIGNQDIRLYTITAAMETLLRIPSQIIVTFFRALVRSKVGTFIAAVFAMLMLFYLSLIISAAHDFGDELQWWFYIALGLNVYVFLVGPLFGWMVRMAIARQREFLADADAVLLTRNPDALARALVKITRANDPETKVHPAMARMCIVDSQARHFSNHPSVEERIAVLDRMGSGISQQILEEAKKDGVEKDGIVSGAINRPLPVSVKERTNLVAAAFSGIVAGMVTTAILSIASLMLTVVFGEADSINPGWTPLIPFVPGCVAAGFSAHRAGTLGANVLVFAIGFGLISVWLSSLVGIPLSWFDPEEASLGYQMGAYTRSLLEIVIGALLGARFGRAKKL